jgi:hypothetical protein
VSERVIHTPTRHCFFNRVLLIFIPSATIQNLNEKHLSSTNTNINTQISCVSVASISPTMTNEKQEATPMSREEQLKIWLANKNKSKKTPRGPQHQYHRPSCKQSQHQRHGVVGKGHSAMTQHDENENITIQPNKRRSRTPPIPDNRPFHERLFDNTTVASQLKTRILTERKSLPSCLLETAKKTPSHALPTKVADHTPPTGRTETTKRSKTEPKQPRPRLSHHSSIPMAKRRPSTFRPSAAIFKTPPPQSSTISSNKPKGLIGRELTVDTTTPPPPMSPMESSVQDDEFILEEQEQQQQKFHMEFSAQDDGLVLEEEEQQQQLLKGREHENDVDFHYQIEHDLEVVNQQQAHIHSEEMNAHHHANTDFDAPKEDSPTIVDQVLGGSVTGSTSSGDSFVNFKRRRRKKKKPLANRTNIIDSSDVDRPSFDNGEIKSPYNNQQNYVKESYPLLDWRDNLSPDFEESPNCAQNDAAVVPMAHEDIPEVLDVHEVESVVLLKEQSSLSSYHETSIEFDDEYEARAVKVVARRRRRKRRKASVFIPPSDSVDDLSKHSKEKKSIEADINASSGTENVSLSLARENGDTIDHCIAEDGDSEKQNHSENDGDSVVSSSETNNDPVPVFLNQMPIKHDGTMSLGTIRETTRVPKHGETNDNSELLEEMQQQIDSLLTEKTKLQKRLFSTLKDYEKRVTPFRNLFDDVSLVLYATGS